MHVIPLVQMYGVARLLVDVVIQRRDLISSGEGWSSKKPQMEQRRIKRCRFPFSQARGVNR